MENPNLNYIEEISHGDEIFKQKIISLLKEELPREIEIYQQNFEKKDYAAAAKDVHKLKHKLAVLGITESQNLASQFEQNLKNNDKTLHLDFDAIIKKISKFVEKL